MPREIIFSEEALEDFDPLDKKTLRVEEKLCCLEMLPGGRIQGAEPIGYTALRKNASVLNYAGKSLIIAPEGNKIVVLAVGKHGKDLKRTITRLASGR